MYKLINDPITGKLACIQRTSDNVFIPVSDDNTDYQEFLRWKELGNEPLPAETN